MTPDPHKALREHLLYVLRGGGAHPHFDKAVADIPPDVRGRKVPPPHSPWRLLEHLRIAQWDILEFSRNPKHVSPPWPDGYWGVCWAAGSKRIDRTERSVERRVIKPLKQSANGTVVVS